MADFQTLTAAVTLAGLAVTAIELVQQVVDAPEKAAELFRHTNHLRAIAESIAEASSSRDGFPANADRSPGEDRILKNITSSLETCQQTFASINTKLKPLKSAGSKLKFVNNKSFFKNHTEILDRQIKELTLSFSVLHSFDLQCIKKLVAEKLVAPGPSNTTTEPVISSQTCTGRNEAPQIRDVVRAGSDIAGRDATRDASLHHAARNLDSETLQGLLVWASSLSDDEKAGFLDHKDRDGQTALMIVSKYADKVKSIHLARALIGQGCDIHAHDSVPRYALSFAVRRPLTPETAHFVVLLREHGADVQKMIQAHQKRYEMLEGKYRDLFKHLPSPTLERRMSSAEPVRRGSFMHTLQRTFSI